MLLHCTGASVARVCSSFHRRHLSRPVSGVGMCLSSSSGWPGCAGRLGAVAVPPSAIQDSCLLSAGLQRGSIRISTYFYPEHRDVACGVSVQCLLPTSFAPSRMRCCCSVPIAGTPRAVGSQLWIPGKRPDIAPGHRFFRVKCQPRRNAAAATGYRQAEREGIALSGRDVSDAVADRQRQWRQKSPYSLLSSQSLRRRKVTAWGNDAYHT